VQFHLYAALRREQRALVESLLSPAGEPAQILSFAQSAYEELVAFLAGRDVLDSARDGDWTPRDLLRHAIAVEIRYRAQVHWSARRLDQDPVAIPADRLPCDRLNPPEVESADTRTAEMAALLERLGVERRRTDADLVTIPPAALNRPSVWGTAEVDVRERMHQIGVHLVEVLVQSEKMLGSRETEARRIARRIAATRGMHVRASPAATIAHLDIQLAELARLARTGR